jgi:oligopeptide transport system substrate-binding protein
MTTPGPGVANQEQLDKFKTITAGMAVEFLPVKPVTNGNILFFNTRTGPTADVRVRRAISLLADRKAMFTAGFGDASWGNFDYWLFSPPYGLATAEISRLAAWDVSYEQRIVQAKALMAQTPYAAGFKLKWPQNTVPEQQRRNYLLADMLRQHLKIDCETNVFQTPELYKLRDSGDFSIIGQDSLSFLGDPNDLLGYFKSGLSSNFCGYNNAAVDALWTQQSQAMDLSKRIALCQEIERQLMADVPCMPLAFNGFVHAQYKYVKGFVVQDASYMSNVALEHVWINK